MTDQIDSQQDARDELQPPKRLRGVPDAGRRKTHTQNAPGADDTAQESTGASQPEGGKSRGAPAEDGDAPVSQTADENPKASDAAGADAKGADAAGAQAEDADAKTPDAKSPDSASASVFRRFRLWRNIAIVVAVLAVVCFVLFGLFSWNRWHRFDDAADMQGQWYVAGTEVPISIDSNAIHFNEKTAYEYVLDDSVKTIRFTLGNMQGSGHYWFSADREYLVIFDGDDYTKWATAFDDLGRDAGNWLDSVFGNDLVLPSGDGVIALSRTPNSGTTGSEPHESEASQAASSDALSSQPGSGDGQANPASSDAAAPGDGASSSGSSPKDVFAEVADQAYNDARQASDAAGAQSDGADGPTVAESNAVESTAAGSTYQEEDGAVDRADSSAGERLGEEVG